MGRFAARAAAAVAAAALGLAGLSAAPAHAASSPSASPRPTASTQQRPTPRPAGTPTPSASPTAAPPPLGPALTATPLSVPVLTLPAKDGLRDTLDVRVRSGATGRVDVLVQRGTRTVRVATAVALKRVAAGWQRTVRVPVDGLKRGSWVLVVRRADRPAVLVRTPLAVGSGTPASVRVVPVSSTVQPYRDGVLDAVDTTVTAVDETGAALPVRGTLRLDIGRKHRSRDLRAGRAVIPVTRLPLGAARLTAAVTVLGKELRRTATVVLAPTGVGTMRLARSSDTVQPVVDGLLDSVVLTSSGTASSASPARVSGRLTITGPAGQVVQSWPVPDGTPRTSEWNGRVGTGILPGGYTATLTLRGPEGAAKVRSARLTVTSGHLPYRVRDLFRVAAGNQQGLAVQDGIFYVGYDNGDGTSRIERYDGNGNRFPLTLSPLAIGHAAELAYSTTTRLLYAVNGGAANPTTVWALEPQAADGPSALRATYDLSRLGNNGMVAVDDAKSRLLVFAGSAGNYTVTPLSLADATTTNADGTTTTVPDGTLGASLPIVIEGIPQGIEVVGDRLWVYTSLTKRNRIAQYDLATASLAVGSDLMNPGEGQGLAARLAPDGTTSLYVGTHSVNRVGVLEPVADE